MNGVDFMANVDKMYTYLRGFLIGANMTESIKALSFARQQHSLQTRKDGTPYIVHPLSMACYAVALGLRDDNIIATILLHDVPEDCGVPVDFLPVNNTIRNAVKHMTITKFDTDVDKIETKCRYFNELLESREALICKALDRYNNLSDASLSLSPDAIAKNVAETEILLLPVLKSAKAIYADLADVLFIMRTNLEVLTAILKPQYWNAYTEWKCIYERQTSVSSANKE
jgi:GTP pyrophosphokinase